MRFTTVLAAVAIAGQGVTAQFGPFNFPLIDVIGFDLTSSNHYGSPLPPWKKGQPGWYYGSSPFLYPDIPCLSGILCKILSFYPYAIQCPHKPPPPPKPTSTHKSSTSTTATSTSSSASATPTTVDGYTPTFSNITGAVQADDFQTFGLVDTVAECMAMCDSVSGCTFINSYHDVNGKGGSTQLTCSLFTLCHSAADADNVGGQSQPDGSVDFIIDSDGWCKGVLPTR